MIVLALSNCSNALRGDLTKWLFEVDTNIYVGKHTARVRDKIWDRVTENTKSGRAVMVYPTNNEQGFDFRIWGTTWEPIDFDGLKLMMRPHPGGVNLNIKKNESFLSKAENRKAAQKYAHSKKRVTELPESYVVIDIVTTGDSIINDEIIAIECIKCIYGVNEIFSVKIQTNKSYLPNLNILSDIPNEIIPDNGRELHSVINEFRLFVEELPLIMFNATVDLSFIRKAYKQCNFDMPNNSVINIMSLADKLLDDPPELNLMELANHFKIDVNEINPITSLCHIKQMLYERLRSI